MRADSFKRAEHVQTAGGGLRPVDTACFDSNNTQDFWESTGRVVLELAQVQEGRSFIWANIEFLFCDLLFISAVHSLKPVIQQMGALTLEFCHFYTSQNYLVLFISIFSLGIHRELLKYTSENVSCPFMLLFALSSQFADFRF